MFATVAVHRKCLFFTVSMMCRCIVYLLSLPLSMPSTFPGVTLPVSAFHNRDYIVSSSEFTAESTRIGKPPRRLFARATLGTVESRLESHLSLDDCLFDFGLHPPAVVRTVSTLGAEGIDVDLVLGIRVYDSDIGLSALG